MPPAIESIFEEWSLPPWLTLALLLAAWVYLRGWWAIRKTRRGQFTPACAGYFLLGLGLLWIAIASPLDGFADASLSSHMVQHLLLMSIVPPVLLLGLPLVPLLRGLPRWILRPVAAPVLRSPAVRHFGRWMTSPLAAWIAMNGMFLFWHMPASYDFALRHEYWHDFEHACFLVSSLAFWWCIVRPWPARQPWKSWEWLLYLLSADVVNTALSAFLAFCDRPVYNYYTASANPFQMSPLADQILGAAIMWVAGSLVFLAPAVSMTFRQLQTPGLRHETRNRALCGGTLPLAARQSTFRR